MRGIEMQSVNVPRSARGGVAGLGPGRLRDMVGPGDADRCPRPGQNLHAHTHTPCMQDTSLRFSLLDVGCETHRA